MSCEQDLRLPSTPCDQLILLDPEAEGIGAGVEITAWQVSASLALSYSGSIDLLDPCGLRACCPTEYTADPENPTQFEWRLLNRALQIYLTATGGALLEYPQDPPVAEIFDPEALFGIHRWVYGILTSEEQSWDLDKRTLRVPFRSRFDPLARKALNTDHYYNYLTDASYVLIDRPLFGLNETISVLAPVVLGADQVLQDIVDNYIPIPIGAYDFSGTSPEPISGPVSGNNSQEEMGLIAMAGKSTLFVDQYGNYVTRPWKDLQYVIDNGVDVEVPLTLVTEAKVSESPLSGPTEIKVEGAYVSAFEYGWRPFAIQPVGSGGGFDGATGYGTFCITNPLASPEHRFGMNRLIGVPEDWKNAVFVVRDRATNTVHTISGSKFKDNKAFVEFLQHNNLQWVNGGIFDFEGHVRVRGPGERVPQSLGSSPHEALVRRVIGPWADFVRSPRSFNPFLHSIPLALGSGVRSAANFDATNPYRRSLLIKDPCYVSKIGPVQETLDNKYLIAPEQLFDYAIRRFQEARFSTRTWSFELAYAPSIKINDTVRVRTPLIENAECEVVGLVTEMSTKWAASEEGPKASTSITVADFCGLNECEITSPNLLFDPVPQGMGAYWQVLRTQGVLTLNPVPIAAVAGGYGQSIIQDEGEAMFVLLHPYVTPGREYTFTYTIDHLVGGTLLCYGSVNGPSVPPSGIFMFNTLGTHSVTFTPSVGHNSVYFVWTIAGNSEFRFGNCSLTTTGVI